MSEPQPANSANSLHRPKSDVPFYTCFLLIGTTYLVLIVGMLVADVGFISLSGFADTFKSKGLFSAMWGIAIEFYESFAKAFAKEEIRFAIILSLISCTISALLSLLVAIPIGYLMSRFRFFGKNLIDAILDIPIVLPPLVIGISLLILFQTSPGESMEELTMFMVNGNLVWFAIISVVALTWAMLATVLLTRMMGTSELQRLGALLIALLTGMALFVVLQLDVVQKPCIGGINTVLGVVGISFPTFTVNDIVVGIGAKRMRGVTYDLLAVILAQFAVACAFAVRTMRVTFDHIDARREQVAMTLGCSRGQAFFRITLPESRPGVITAGTLAWARSMGEFGPILVFAGATRLKTEVLPTTVFLELSIGDINAAVAVSMIMVTAAVIVLITARSFGSTKAFL